MGELESWVHCTEKSLGIFIFACFYTEEVMTMTPQQTQCEGINLEITVPVSVAAVGAGGACKNMAAHKCEREPPVGGWVCSCGGVKSCALIRPPGWCACQTAGRNTGENTTTIHHKPLLHQWREAVQHFLIPQVPQTYPGSVQVALCRCHWSQLGENSLSNSGWPLDSQLHFTRWVQNLSPSPGSPLLTAPRSHTLK